MAFSGSLESVETLESKDRSYAHLGTLKATIIGFCYSSTVRLQVRTSVVTPVETHLLHTVTHLAL